MSTVRQTRPRSGRLTRQSAAALNGDIVGYSRMIAEDVEGAVAGVERARSVTVRSVDEFGGELADFSGDNFLAIFPSTAAAFGAARSISERLESEAASGSRIRFRMGIAVGELITDGSHFYGEAVNIAARIREIALPGGVALSGDVFIRLDSSTGGFESLGLRRFKNIPDLVRVYRYHEDHQQGSADSARVAGTPRPCLAFDGVWAVDPSVARVAGVLTREIRTALIGLPGLTLARAPSEHSVGMTDGPTARHSLEATVDRLGNRIRVYLELIEISRWLPIWSQRYELDEDDLPELADVISADVVGAVEVELVIGDFSRVYRTTLSPASVDRVHEAITRAIIGTPEGLERASALLEQVSRDEPAASEGPALGSFVTILRVLTGQSPEPAVDLINARALADEGRRRGDFTALSDLVNAQVLLSNGQVEEALEAVDAAVSARKACDATFAMKASVLRYAGRWQPAVELAQQAIRLTPWPFPWYRSVLASALYVGGRYEDLVDVVEPLRGDGSADLEALLLLAAAEVAVGMPRRAGATLDLARSRFPGTSTEGFVRHQPFVDPEVIERWHRHLDSASAADGRQ